MVLTGFHAIPPVHALEGPKTGRSHNLKMLKIASQPSDLKLHKEAGLQRLALGDETPSEHKLSPRSLGLPLISRNLGRSLFDVKN